MGQPRKPKGTSSGGQFDNMTHAESTASLDASTGADTETPEVLVDAFGNSYEPGSFPRPSPTQGGNWVSSPDPDQVVKTGPNAGQRKFFNYGGDGNAGISSDHTNLLAWQQRSITRGVAMDPGLVDRFNAALAEAEPSDRKSVGNDFVEQAHETAKSYDQAERGRFVNGALDVIDAGGSPDEAQLQAGEAIGVRRATVEHVARDWADFQREKGMKVAAVHLPVVNDDLKKAGHISRTVTLDKPLTVTTANGDVTVPAGTPVIAEITTKKMYVGREGTPRFSGRDAAKLATQADSVPYSIADATRGDWGDVPGGKPSTDVGLIIHCDTAKAAKGFGGSFTVYTVDLSAGREYARAGAALKTASYAAANKSVGGEIDPPTSAATAA